jgi:TonB family protein
MFHFDTSDIQRVAVSAIGALLLSTACVVGAVGPAKAATADAPATMSAWQDHVEQQIDGTLRSPLAFFPNGMAVATVNVRLAADGSVSDVKLAHSAGSRVLDREALRTAKAIRYPALPGRLGQKENVVALKLFFGRDAQAVAPALKAAAEQAVANNAAIERNAAQTQLARR